MMCNTLILKPFFIALVAIGTALTAISMFTPGWRQYSSSGTEDINVGIITRSCGGASNFTACGDWWDGQPAWMKTVIIFMILALIVELVVLIWAILSCMTFCLPSLFFPLPVLCGLAASFLIVAIAVYGAKNQDQINGGFPSSLNDEGNIGYSFWVGVGAMLIMIMATFVGCVIGGLSTVSNN